MGSAGWTRKQTYAAGTNRLDRVSMPGDPANGPYSGVHQHDAAGNVVAMPNLAALGWDHAGRFVNADLQGGGTAYFTYDSSGQRVRKLIQQKGKILERVYVGNYERYRERSGTALADSTLTLERTSVHANDGQRRFAIVETKTVDTSVVNLVPTPLCRFQFPNHLGSACLETDPDGEPISYEEYYPYGGSSYRAGDVDKRYRFSGKERDEETGFYYYGARYYAPWLARWISCDPAGFVDGPNCYVYAQNRPTCMIDFNGLQASDELDAGIPLTEDGTRTVTAATPGNSIAGAALQEQAAAGLEKRDYVPGQGASEFEKVEEAVRPTMRAGSDFVGGAVAGATNSAIGSVQGPAEKLIKGAELAKQHPVLAAVASTAGPVGWAIWGLAASFAKGESGIYQRVNTAFESLKLPVPAGVAGATGNILAQAGVTALSMAAPGETGAAAESGAASESAALGSSGGGISTREGAAFQLKHLDKHLPGTNASTRLIEKEGSAHIFNDRATLERVENQLFQEGKFTGTIRGSERYGLRFAEPIGQRITEGGATMPLTYGELVLSLKTGMYHVMPRTGPAR